MLARFWRLVFGQLAADAAVVLLAITVIGIPFAIWKYVDWQFVQQEILFEDKSIPRRVPRQHARSSADTGGGPCGSRVLLAAERGRRAGARLRADLREPLADLDQPLRLARLRAPGPYVAIGRTLLYFDLQAREEGRRSPGVAGGGRGRARVRNPAEPGGDSTRFRRPA